MKKNILLSITLLFSLSCFAQPTGDVFPDFTFNDLEGTEHHLQSYLDEGKTVVIDVFATWCGLCQSSTGGIETLHEEYGQGADDGSLVVLSFERDPLTTNEQDFIDTYNVTSPVITEATELIADTWNITYQPRYFVICPDGSFLAQLNSPIYNDPSPLVELSEECAPLSVRDETTLSAGVNLINTAVSQSLIYDNSLDNIQFQILDVTGQISKVGQLTTGRGFITMDGMSKGMYFIRITSGAAAITHRIVKVD